MKQKKFLGVMTVALSVVLASCGGGVSSSSRHVHTWGAWETVTAPTCTEKGSEKRVCSGCLEEATRDIAALGHAWGDTVVLVAPGVGIEGSGTRTCSRCNVTEDVVIPALEPTITIDAAELIKEGDKVYIRISGTEENFTVENFVWAFGLKRYNADDWLIGSADPADTDFNVQVAITPLGGEGNENKGTYTVDFNLSDIVIPEGINKAGEFTVYAGPKGLYGTFPTIDLAPGNKADSGHNYYFRNDAGVGSLFTLCADEVPPYFHLADAKVVFLKDTQLVEEEEVEVDVAWGVIFGEALDQSKSVAELQAEVDAAQPFIQFQSSGNQMTRRDGDGQFYFEVKKEGSVLMVYLHINIDFMLSASNATYNTHLNLKTRRQANCVMEGTFGIGDDEAAHTFLSPDGAKTISVFSNPNGPNHRDNAYGNLGWKTADAPAE